MKLRIVYNPWYKVYEVYNDCNGETYFSGTNIECENFVNEIHGGF